MANFGTVASTSCRTTAQLLNFTGTGFTDTWETMTWSGLSDFNGNDIWTDGNRLFYSGGSGIQYYYDDSINSWVSFTWSNPYGYTNLKGRYVWSDGINIIYCEIASNYAYYYILDTVNFSISSYQSIGNLSMLGLDCWHIGSNYYFSNYYQYYLDNSTNTWVNSNIWLGETSSLLGRDIWSDGINIYCSNGSYQVCLDIVTNTWETMTWTGLSSFDGQDIWTDGVNIFYTYGLNSYILDVSTHTWSPYTFNGLNSNTAGRYIYCFNNNIYTNVIYSNNPSLSLILQKATPVTPLISSFNTLSITNYANYLTLQIGENSINITKATTYTVTTTVTNGTYSGINIIRENGTGIITISADNGYSLPSTITVSGASYTYDNTTGEISLSNPTENITISVVCIIENGWDELDLTGTTWIFNLETDSSTFGYSSISRPNDAYAQYELNGTYFDGYADNSIIGLCNFSNNICYYTTLDSVDETTLTITGGTDATNTTLINWLKDNATLISW